MFNPHPQVQTMTVGGQAVCYVIDDALLDPQRWIDYAATHAGEFVEVPHSAYPGRELRMPKAISEQLHTVFALYLRRRFEARRTLEMDTRLSLATRLPGQLEPSQWLCHVDHRQADPAQVIVASVLYLFHDESLGGTGFYRPLRPRVEIVELVEDSMRMGAIEFYMRYRLRPGYMTESNAYFEKVLTVPARFNRLLFYSGQIFHSGDVRAPERLSADPRTGRLTLNGFFSCRRSLA